ncbi:MAG: glycoside hydrolase family 2 TIM barrel-domain containing protein [Eubacteriales bacterium]|nr:glycoside hydrolase family 2 TIM barrel-domain containing protein [Eubacteriales bacterium]
MRYLENWNEGWNFAKAANLEEARTAKWEAVSLPHTWNNVDGQDGGNDYYRGRCLYEKTFEKPKAFGEGKQVYLEFQAAAMIADVLVNGKKLAHHEGGYSTFRVNLTDVLEETNRIQVFVDNAANDFVYPQMADFTFYGGLYRDVTLIVVPEDHFELEKDGTPGMKVTPQVEEGRAEIALEAWVPGGRGQVRFTVDGMSKTAEVKDGSAKVSLTIENVHLWDGVNDPFLYTAKAELLIGEDIADEIVLPFGCRTFAIDKEKGFFLNGKPYPLRGVSRHQDRVDVGNALTEAMHREDMAIIKEIGANTIRLAHYQHAQYFYDLCDREGMIVWAEIPYITKHMEKGRQNTLDQMRELIVQNYHHPSIVCWGLSNEITASGTVTEDLIENHRLLNDLCHRMDSTRLTTMAHVFMLETESPLIDLPDIGSYNLYFGWYLGELSQNDEFFDEFHETYPERVIGLSEYGADANPQFQASEPERGDYTESYQCLYHEHLLACIEARPYLWATHVWNMFDFAADGRDEGGAHGRNQKGLVTMDRKLKKDAFYLYKAAWSREPFVHLCGRRYAERAEAQTEIKVYSNQPKVSLYVDGKLTETQEGRTVFRFQTVLSGEHLIEAKAGACTDSMRIRRVPEPNKAYQFLKEGDVVNWFDRDTYKKDFYGIKDRLKDLQANPDAAKLTDEIMAKARASRGDVAKSTQGNENLRKMMGGMSLESVLKQVKGAVPAEEIQELNRKLQSIRKPEA